MQRDREPESPFIPPTKVMRSAFGLTIPCALAWAIIGSVLWHLVLDNYGTTWPAFFRESWLASGLALLYGVFGVVFALGLRWLIWVVFENRPRRTPVRDVHARKDIPVGRDWHEV